MLHCNPYGIAAPVDKVTPCCRLPDASAIAKLHSTLNVS
jgi:hypothetical protein